MTGKKEGALTPALSRGARGKSAKTKTKTLDSRLRMSGMTEGEEVVLFGLLLDTFQFPCHEFVEGAGDEGLVGHSFLYRPFLQAVQVA